MDFLGLSDWAWMSWAWNSQSFFYLVLWNHDYEFCWMGFPCNSKGVELTLLEFIWIMIMDPRELAKLHFLSASNQDHGPLQRVGPKLHFNYIQLLGYIENTLFAPFNHTCASEQNEFKTSRPPFFGFWASSIKFCKISYWEIYQMVGS